MLFLYGSLDITSYLPWWGAFILIGGVIILIIIISWIIILYKKSKIRNQKNNINNFLKDNNFYDETNTVRISKVDNPCEICINYDDKLLSANINPNKENSVEQAIENGLFHLDCKHKIIK